MNNKELQIQEIELFKLVSVLKKPISDATHTLSEISFVVLRLKLRNGIVGESYYYPFNIHQKPSKAL